MTWLRYDTEMRQVEADKPWTRRRALDGGR